MKFKSKPSYLGDEGGEGGEGGEEGGGQARI